MTEYLRDSFLATGAAVGNLMSAPILGAVGIVASIKRVFTKKNVHFHNIVITGASHGIGEQIALYAAQYATRLEVRHLLLLGRSLKDLERVKESCLRFNDTLNIDCIASDFSDADQIASTARKIVEWDQTHWGGIDVLFSNAGMTIQNAATDSDTDSSSSLASEDRMIDEWMQPDFVQNMVMVNLVAHMQLTRYILPKMRERSRGHLVFTSSVNGMIGPANQLVYNACKSGVLSWARDLRALEAPNGIDVHVVTPGFIAGTNMTEPQLVDEDAHIPRVATVEL
jgi:short-subunit dehydrogenase